MSDRFPKTLFVCGIAGIGKTHLIARVLPQFPLAVTWRASAIIQEARDVADPDLLRRMSRDEIALSQGLLITGLERRRRESTSALIVLDGHSVVDSDDGLIDIAVETIRQLRVQVVVHLDDTVARIAARRASDNNRRRPARTIEQLSHYQSRSLANCKLYESRLGIELLRLRAGDEEGLAKTIAELLAAEMDQRPPGGSS